LLFADVACPQSRYITFKRSVAVFISVTNWWNLIWRISLLFVLWLGKRDKPHNDANISRGGWGILVLFFYLIQTYTVAVSNFDFSESNDSIFKANSFLIIVPSITKYLQVRFTSPERFEFERYN
jgi:hypothetical protein